MTEPKGEAAKPEGGKAGKYLHKLKFLKFKGSFSIDAKINFFFLNQLVLI